MRPLSVVSFCPGSHPVRVRGPVRNTRSDTNGPKERHRCFAEPRVLLFVITNLCVSQGPWADEGVEESCTGGGHGRTLSVDKGEFSQGPQVSIGYLLDCGGRIHSSLKLRSSWSFRVFLRSGPNQGVGQLQGFKGREARQKT